MRIECYCFQKNGSLPVQGAVITVSAEAGSISRTTDFNGRCVFSVSGCGVYTVRQTSAPAFLVKSNTVHRAAFPPDAPDGAVIRVGFANALKYPAGAVQTARAAARAAELRERMDPCRPFPYYAE